MTRRVLITLALLVSFAATYTTAQTRLDKPITHKDGDFMFMGKHELGGTNISGLGACIAFGSPRTPMARIFERWITDLSDTAALKMFNLGRCDLVGYRVEDKPGNLYRNVNSFKQFASGKSIYLVDTDKLVLVKKFAGEIYYIVAAKGSAPHKFSQLNVCGPPEIIKRFFKSRKRGAIQVSSSYCHDLAQQINKVKRPTKYAASMKRVSAVLFTKKDYLAQKKKGLFRRQAVYSFDGGDAITPVR